MILYGPLPIRVITHNIRYATQSPFKGEERWEIRRPYLINELCFSMIHCNEAIICLQEVLHHQLVDILVDLGNRNGTWNYVGVGRDDGLQAGEYSPILYRPEIWEVMAQKTVWLSKTPDRPSKSWDAASTRILTIAVFQHRLTRKILVVLNTHLDDQGSKSRLEAAKIILERVRLFGNQPSQGGTYPIVLTGDFNSEPEQEAYGEMTNVKSPMVDLQTMVPKFQRYGDHNTFSGFDSKTTRRKRIDFIFVNGKRPDQSCQEVSDREVDKSRWLVQGYSVLPNLFEDGVYNSDHQAVIADLSFV